MSERAAGRASCVAWVAAVTASSSTGTTAPSSSQTGACSWIAFCHREPHSVDRFRLDGQPVHHSIGARLLAASGHPDAALRMPSDDVSAGRFH
jgi:hypothetical protein